MRVLVISDIHGNLAALHAVVAREYDALVCLGDLVGYGPEPGAVVRWIRQHATVVIQGNHDRALAEGRPPGCRAHFQRLADATAPIGVRQLSGEERTYLGELRREATATFDGVRYRFLHATPRDPLYEYLGPEVAAWRQQVADLDADALVVGHTHLSFNLDAGRCRVINPGSVGQPKDGDPRAAYLLLDGGAVRLERASYPVERTVDALAASGVPTAELAALAELLRTGTVSGP